VGHKVQRLTRVAVGPIRLGEMPRGAVRQLTPEEVKKLRAAAVAGRMGDREEVEAGGSNRPPMKPRGQRPERGGKAGGTHAHGIRKKKSAGQSAVGRRIIGERVAPSDERAGAEGGQQRPGGNRFKKGAGGFKGRAKKGPGGPKGKRP
jgi:23S rRNA pseudouridine2605 synthase